jgi:hypothetical protein
MLHLKIPGHTCFSPCSSFCWVGEAYQDRGNIVGLLAGILSAMLGMGKEGPLVALKFLLPGVIVDLGGVIYPGLPSSYIACMIVGIVASVTRFITFFAVELLIGMEKELILGHAAVSLSAVLVV